VTETRQTRTLREEEDVTEEVLAAIPDALEWFEDRRSLPTEEFIDRFSDTYGYPEWELDNYDSPAARKVLREARRIRKEQDQWG
jgi:hypothetical protein